MLEQAEESSPQRAPPLLTPLTLYLLSHLFALWPLEQKTLIQKSPPTYCTGAGGLLITCKSVPPSPIHQSKSMSEYSSRVFGKFNRRRCKTEKNENTNISGLKGGATQFLWKISGWKQLCALVWCFFTLSHCTDLASLQGLLQYNVLNLEWCFSIWIKLLKDVYIYINPM